MRFLQVVTVYDADPMIEDAELLRRYAAEKSEEAFAERVRRRIGLVYSVAWGHTRDAQRAGPLGWLGPKAESAAVMFGLLGWIAAGAAAGAMRVAP